MSATNAARTHYVTNMEFVNATMTGPLSQTAVCSLERVIRIVMATHVVDLMPISAQHVDLMLIATPMAAVYATTTGADRFVTSSKATATAHAHHALVHSLPTVVIVEALVPSALAVMVTAHVHAILDTKDVTATRIMMNVMSAVMVALDLANSNV